jgi:membrane-anchored mycosin MYCP
MRSSTFLRRSKVRRTIALSAAAGVLALAGPALPAAAQTASDPYAPPPLNPGVSTGSQRLTPVGPEYQQEKGCIQAGSGVIEEKPWGQLTLGFEQAQAQGYTGQGQKIAVIDTGINPHWRLPSIEDGGSSVPAGGAKTDCDGHGTVVAGIIAARPDQNTGFVGIAPGSTLMSLRQSSANWVNKAKNNKTIGDTQTMAQAINYAVDNGAQVINISQSSCQAMAEAKADPIFNQMLQSAVARAYERNVVVVAAAGNAGSGGCQKNPPGSPTTAVLPAWYDKYVLTVASVNQQGGPSEFTVPGPWVDVAAPGENIVSLDPGPGASGLANQLATGQGGQASPIQGTSFAAPYVSGLVALIKDKAAKANTTLSAQQIMDRIKQTSIHAGGTEGRNDVIGYGMVNPTAALNDVVLSEHGKQPPPPGPVRLSADVLVKKDWPAILIALGVAGAGIGAVLFTAFLVNAVRNLRARQADRRA